MMQSPEALPPEIDMKQPTIAANRPAKVALEQVFTRPSCNPTALYRSSTILTPNPKSSTLKIAK